MARKGTDLFSRWLSLGCLAMWIAMTVGVSAVQATGATGARAGSSRHKASSAQVIHRPGTTAIIRDVRRTVLPDAVRITIELDGEVPFHDERIESPAREDFRVREV